MENVLRLEEALMFALGILLFSQLEYHWWIFAVLLLSPDISMLGYLLNNKVGAFCYNIFHHKGIALCIYFLGILIVNPVAQLIGIILFSHASLDRIVGYGLKYTDSFKHTHLGKINTKGL